MKNLLLIISFLVCSFVYSQTDSSIVEDTNTYRILKTDGGNIVGKILSQDPREVLLLTNDNREIYIPQHLISKIELIDQSDFNANGDYVGEDKFATRYFITTNGLPIKKGEHYVQWNLFGPDFQFGVADNFGLGVMTSWLGIPIIATAKYSVQLSENAQFAVGALAGTGAWAAPDFGGFLPFGTFSFGDRSKNIAFSFGYGGVWESGDFGGRGLASVAGMLKIAPKLSLVFDSFIIPPGKTTYSDVTYVQPVYNSTTGQYEDVTFTETRENRKPGFALLMPGIRWHVSEKKAFQIGVSGIIADGIVVPIPLPTFQWYRSL